MTFDQVLYGCLTALTIGMVAASLWGKRKER